MRGIRKSIGIMILRYFPTLLLLGIVNGFSPLHGGLSSKKCISPTSKTVLGMDLALINEIKAARGAFLLSFFGAVGTASVGRAAIPITLNRIKFIRDLAGQGESLGGESISLFGYPEDIKSKDVEKILSNNMTMNEIVQTFPIEKTRPGFLSYFAFLKANEDVYPLAVRAVFDSFYLGINKNIVNPNTAQTKIDSYRSDINTLKRENIKSLTVGVSALIILLGLLGFVDGFAVYHAWRGWFPEWQGFSNLPMSLFDKDIGVLTISNFWIEDVPE